MDHHIMKTPCSIKRVVAILGLFFPCFMILGFGARSAPINGTWSDSVEIQSKVWSKTNTFRGGERASVMAIGDPKQAGVKLRVAVYDAKGTLIAEDKGESDFVGLVWYPPRDGDYRVDVSHNGADVNNVYVAIK
jgi:hypothetical protein